MKERYDTRKVIGDFKTGREAQGKYKALLDYKGTEGISGGSQLADCTNGDASSG